ncbi:MAG: hypothetical protein ISS26_06100 [Candidatus Omnitrophica bacterium]|nr:hypothetical protein [Candidatus Omnitrophota bacterium]
MGEENDFSPEIHNIKVTRSNGDRFVIVLGTKTEIPGLYSASTEIEVDRALLEQFVASAEEALGEGAE